jgi:rhamnulokinase
MPKFLAIDLGAESGRSILGTLVGHKIELEEILRFPNRQIRESGHIHWDFPYLLEEIKKSMTFVGSQGHKDLLGIGVDTWGVDFGLMGKDNRLLTLPFAYRDSRTDGMMAKAIQMMPKDEIYARTGTQFMQINTIYQLLSMVEASSRHLEEAETLLFMPDLFGFHLSGAKYSEYSIASTSQLLDAHRKEWSQEIFSRLSLPSSLMAPLQDPGTVVGRLLPDVAADTGLPETDVIAPASHDTASAVAAVPAQSAHWAYLSSGTWSLLGVERDTPLINESSLNNNFTNEGGTDGKIRFLRNTMGLWLLQGCVRAWGANRQALSYDEMLHQAQEASSFKSVVDPDDELFLNPPEMTAAIDEFCMKTRQPIPATRGEYVRCILQSLALKYRYIVEKLNAITSDPIEVLHIVGGGSRNELLNQWSSNAMGIPAVAGPTEAAAVGNILVQAIAERELDGIDEGRRIVADSFPLKTYEPQEQQVWNDAFEANKHLFTT